MLKKALRIQLFSIREQQKLAMFIITFEAIVFKFVGTR